MPVSERNPSEILLIEDDSNDVFLIRRAFGRIDAKLPLRVLEDGEVAIAHLNQLIAEGNREQHPLPLLILLDLKLPRRSGLEVLEWLKRQSAVCRIPVVVLTSSRESVDVDRAYDLGANSYLVKPVSFDALSNMIQTIDTYWLKFNQSPSIQKA
ncbi:response regulator [Lyngbya sp. CCY1209]|nr:response regulator [Lyngbya sp. CCY1209]